MHKLGLTTLEDEVLVPQRLKNLRGKIPIHLAAGASRTVAVLRTSVCVSEDVV